MTNKNVLDLAMLQSAIDANCKPDDFLKNENVVVLSKSNPNARKYLELPLYCNLISYGNNIVASVDAEFSDEASAYINKYSVEHCFETPNLYILNSELQKKNMQICFMAEYFLPDIDVLTSIKFSLDSRYEIKILEQNDFADLYTPEWSNALCEKRKNLDMLGVGAYFNGELIGLAGCSADCDTMWQIGIDVLHEHRRNGIAAALTSRLALEILALGKVPFYCAAWANIKSVRNAIKSGFRPAWVEMTAKSMDFVANMNR